MIPAHSMEVSMLVGFTLLLAPAFAMSDTGMGTGTADTDTTCAAEGDPCTADDGAEGECDADLVCVADDGGGCSTTGGASGWLALGLGAMALRRRR
jgi:uncharacterized protein (TIGR03382 family)